MANLVKITEVVLYTGLTKDVAECYECKKLLDDAGVKYQIAHYGDDSVHEQNFSALSTWSFGPDFKQYTFTKFPIITWREYYDDYERFIEVAQSVAELQASNLIKNPTLVK